jgi:hypothetical protein
VHAFAIAGLLLALPPSNDGEPASTRPCDAAIRTHELDDAAFRSATSLRLPDLRLRGPTSEPEPECRDRLHAFVEVRPREAGVWELTLILSDGRAWFRTIASEPDEAARTVASALANLLAAIEDDAIVADAEDVALPDELAESPPEPEVAEPEPEISEPEPEVAKPEPEPPPRSTPALLFEVAPRVGAGAALGLTPAPGFRAGGAELGALFRLRSGLAVDLGLRVAGRRAGELGLVRVRVAAAIGYVVRAARFELPILVAATIEPWWVREAGSPVDLGAPPLIGTGLRLAPGGRIDLGARELRVAGVLGLDLAVEPSGTVPAIRLAPDDDPRLRVGGLEPWAGLEFGLWIPVRRRVAQGERPGP